jgi:hypothetical protein
LVYSLSFLRVKPWEDEIETCARFSLYHPRVDFDLPTIARADDRLIGIWTLDEGFQRVELLFRSDGRYQIDTIDSDQPSFSFTDRGRYEVNGQGLALTPYDYLGEPQSVSYEFQIAGSSLSLTRTDIESSQVMNSGRARKKMFWHGRV